MKAVSFREMASKNEKTNFLNPATSGLVRIDETPAPAAAWTWMDLELLSAPGPRPLPRVPCRNEKIIKIIIISILLCFVTVTPFLGRINTDSLVHTIDTFNLVELIDLCFRSGIV